LPYLLAFSLLAALHPVASENASQRGPDDEEYAVYSAVTNERYINKDDKVFVLLDVTEAYTFDNTNTSRYLTKQLSPLEETFDDFKQKNTRPYRLERHFALKVPYVLISEKQDREIFRHGPVGWKKFYEKYPQSPGEFRVSRVGFNRAKDKAILYISRSSGSLSGSGVVLTLSKKDNDWKIVDEFTIWQS
jgi:hypothetical protein